MAEGGRKRKANRHRDDGERPKKKAAVDSITAIPNQAIQVTYIDTSRGLLPAIASSSGTNCPDITYNAYTKAQSTHRTADVPSLLLHSSAHPSLEFTATPDSNSNVSHYIGVFDPKTSSLKVIPAHSTSLRSALRSELAEVKERNAARTFAQQREDLGREFGTKKAKKMIASKTENAITAAESAKDVESAVLNSVNAAAENLPARHEQHQSILASKPIPKPQLDAEVVKDVYPLATLVPQGELRNMNVKEWQDAVKANQEVRLTSRFVANRLRNVVATGDVQKLKALKYLLLLINFNDALQHSRSGKKLPQRDQFKSKLAEWPEAMVDNVRRRFAEGSELNKWHVDNMSTHIAALSLFIDEWRTDTYDLKEDLRLDSKQMSQYFLELGCKVSPPTEKERLELKITNKALAAQKRFAKLKLPLDFPKARLPPRRR